MQWRLCFPFLSCLLCLSEGWTLPFLLSDKPESTVELPTYHKRAWQTARVAVHYLNYQTASPSSLLDLGEVKKATVKNVPGIGSKYNIQFTTEDLKTKEKVGACFATVFFQYKKPHPAVNVKCTNNINPKQVKEDDYNFYKEIKQQSQPITANDIPDSHGNVDPSNEPLRDLAFIGSSFMLWEMSSESLYYFMAQVKSVKQRLRNDYLLDFDYNIILHEFPTQEMVPCHMHVVWYPGQHMKVKYDCSPVAESQESEEGSSGGRSEEGSASFGNF
ncbi:retinoic acid receptor responder protein 1 [Ambystoma mexicanum]|uniref:retinoic acid receptor responder protein 1 n=1 Tax=Ambystoma mexicanum TaxID=8296 RepID=UPI0037E789F4